MADGGESSGVWGDEEEPGEFVPFYEGAGRAGSYWQRSRRNNDLFRYQTEEWGMDPVQTDLRRPSRARIALPENEPLVEQSVSTTPMLHQGLFLSTPVSTGLLQVSRQWKRFADRLPQGSEMWAWYQRFFLSGEVPPDLDDIFVAGGFYRRPETDVRLDANAVLYAMRETQELELDFFDEKRWGLGVSFFANLRTLTVYRVFLGAVPEDVGQLRRLEVLEFYGTEAPLRFSGGLNRLRHLKKFRAESCEMEEWPEGLEELPNLREIDLSKNKFRAIPRQVAEMEWLEVLCMKKQDPSNFFTLARDQDDEPLDFAGMRGLRELDVSENPIAEMEPVIGHFPRLNVLKMTRTYIGPRLEFPEAQFPRLPPLKEFTLWSFFVEEVDESIARFTKLEYVEFEMPLTTLPESLARLRNLRMIRVDSLEPLRFPTYSGFLEMCVSGRLELSLDPVFEAEAVPRRRY